MTLKRARPTYALGGTPTKDHLFGDDKRSLCDSWIYGGGVTVYPEREDTAENLRQRVEDGELCKRCARNAGVLDDAP